MKQGLPIYSINKFEILSNEGDFYGNYLDKHVKKHQFEFLIFLSYANSSIGAIY
jgi:hypothetical protein